MKNEFERYVLMCAKSDYRFEYIPEIGDKVIFVREMPNNPFGFLLTNQIETIIEIDHQACRVLLQNDRDPNLPMVNISWEVLRDPTSNIIPLFAGIGLYKTLIKNLKELMLKKYNKLWDDKKYEWIKKEEINERANYN